MIKTRLYLSKTRKNRVRFMSWCQILSILFLMEVKIARNKVESIKTIKLRYEGLFFVEGSNMEEDQHPYERQEIQPRAVKK